MLPKRQNTVYSSETLNNLSINHLHKIPVRDIESPYLVLLAPNEPIISFIFFNQSASRKTIFVAGPTLASLNMYWMWLAKSIYN